MKQFLSVLLVGLILIYIVDSAFQINGLDSTMLIENLIRFFLGFILFGVWIALTRKFNFKQLLIILVTFLIIDTIIDSFMDVIDLIEMTLHDLFVLSWGAAAGFVFVRCLLKK